MSECSSDSIKALYYQVVQKKNDIGIEGYVTPICTRIKQKSKFTFAKQRRKLLDGQLNRGIVPGPQKYAPDYNTNLKRNWSHIGGSVCRAQREFYQNQVLKEAFKNPSPAQYKPYNSQIKKTFNKFGATFNKSESNFLTEFEYLAEQTPGPYDEVADPEKRAQLYQKILPRSISYKWPKVKAREKVSKNSLLGPGYYELNLSTFNLNKRKIGRQGTFAKAGRNLLSQSVISSSKKAPGVGHYNVIESYNKFYNTSPSFKIIKPNAVKHIHSSPGPGSYEIGVI